MCRSLLPFQSITTTRLLQGCRSHFENKTKNGWVINSIDPDHKKLLIELMSKSSAYRIIFIVEARQTGVNKTLQPFILSSSLNFVSGRKGTVAGTLIAVMLLGIVMPIATSSISLAAYADLPTERDPDIDIETVRLGKGSIPAGGIRILADLEPFYIIDGHVEFNAPANARDLKVIVAESTRKSVTHAVILNPTKIRDIRTGESLYHVDLNEEISGKNPWTDRSDKVDRYNNVYLMNVGEGRRPITFNDQSQATITVVFAS